MPIAIRLPLLFLLGLSVPWSTLAREDPIASPTLSEVTLAGKSFRVEVVHTPSMRAKGLMHRRYLPADQGMLFLFPEARPIAFWMKNTEIRLDILFFDHQSRLVRVHHNVPPCRKTPCTHYPSGSPTALVLELNGGTAEALNLAPGAELGIPNRALLPLAK